MARERERESKREKSRWIFTVKSGTSGFVSGIQSWNLGSRGKSMGSVAALKASTLFFFYKPCFIIPLPMFLWHDSKGFRAVEKIRWNRRLEDDRVTISLFLSLSLWIYQSNSSYNFNRYFTSVKFIPRWIETITRAYTLLHTYLGEISAKIWGDLRAAEWAGGRGGPSRDAEGSRVREQHTPARGWCRQQPAARRRREQQHRRGPRLRGLRKGDSRAMVPEGSGPRVALRLSSLLPLPCASRRRVDVLRQGRQHLLQRGLL